MTQRQLLIYRYLASVKEATLSEIILACNMQLYANTKKHASMTLSRMVKSGYVTRIKRGLYRANEYKPHFKPAQLQPKEQLKLEL